MADKFIKIDEENIKLWHKIADLEDRSRRNNARFRGVPESITAEKIVEYITTCCATLEKGVWEIERAHGLPRHTWLMADIPRDVCMFLSLHFKGSTICSNPQDTDTTFPLRGDFCLHRFICSYHGKT
ncbi:Hypothetical predicted protein [Pelobates cultripes]|uniref:Uncharacterized protein n=1 Tax=Pelobates cultripes TaxID=61616 RepID=A0AAD1RZW0_PELCU|nr:Hypothetical predicted protein [Pelobates cultripes]